MTIMRRGFTIVELLIVIAVIGILALVAIVSFNGVQAKGRDAAVREAAVKFNDALLLYAQKYTASAMPKGGTGSTSVATATGCADGTGGYQANQYPGVQCTLGDAMIAAGYLPSDFFDKMPPNRVKGNTPKNDLITQHCSDGYYLFFYQQAASTADVQAVNDIANGVCSSQSTNILDKGMGGYMKLDVL